MQAAVASSVVSFRPSTAFSRPALRPVAREAASCSACSLRDLCMPVDVRDPGAKALFDQLVATRVRLRKGDVLFGAGDRSTALYAIRRGSLKTVMLSDDGAEQILGYHLPAEIIGAECMGDDVHACQAVALEDSEVCMLPVERIERLAREDQSFQRCLYRLLSGAIGRERATLLMLATMRAEQRLASFLLDLSNRYQARGYSSKEFVLRMTREEIGSHLGLKLETVSRLFSRFAAEGLIRTQGKTVTLLDRMGLQQLVSGS